MANVVLVHGFLNNAFVMRRLHTRLRAAGHTCHAPTLRPGDARRGLADQARQLKEFIDANLGATASFFLIGFSMGALVARYYLQELDGAARAQGYFSISGPHQGTWMAYFYPGQGVRELRPGSAWLRALDATAAERLRGIPLVGYWTPFDAIIRPARHACWPLAEMIRIPAWLHLSMLWNHRVAEDIIRRLGERQAPPLTRS